MNTPIEKVQDLLQQEVSRKEFLRYAAIALLSVVGVTNVLRNLQNVLGNDIGSTNKLTAKQKEASGGYGMSAYGR